MVIELDQAADANGQDATWPREVDLILSAMDAGMASPSSDRRLLSRHSHRTRASLKLYADPADAPARPLFTRDADPRCCGFITQHLLPLGYGGWVTMLAPGGEEVHAECTIYRCRRSVQGWYEGAMRFSRDVSQLADERGAEGRRSRPAGGLRLAE